MWKLSLSNIEMNISVKVEMFVGVTSRTCWQNCFQREWSYSKVRLKGIKSSDLFLKYQLIKKIFLDHFYANLVSVEISTDVWFCTLQWVFQPLLMIVPCFNFLSTLSRANVWCQNIPMLMKAAVYSYASFEAIEGWQQNFHAIWQFVIKPQSIRQSTNYLGIWWTT